MVQSLWTKVFDRSVAVGRTRVGILKFKSYFISELTLSAMRFSTSVAVFIFDSLLCHFNNRL